MKVSGAAKGGGVEGGKGSENCVYFKGEVERKALNCEQLQRGDGWRRSREGGAGGAWEKPDKRNVVRAVGQRNRHFKIRRSYAHQILLEHHHIF